jgi:hypothetical protein
VAQAATEAAAAAAAAAAVAEELHSAAAAGEVENVNQLLTTCGDPARLVSSVDKVRSKPARHQHPCQVYSCQVYSCQVYSCQVYSCQVYLGAAESSAYHDVGVHACGMLGRHRQLGRSVTTRSQAWRRIVTVLHGL